MKHSVLLAASYDLKIHAFDLCQGSQLSELEVTNSQANRLIQYNDSKFFACGYGYILIYDYFSRSKKPVHSIAAHEGNVTDLKLVQQTIFTCGDDKKIKVWDKRSLKSELTIDAGSILNSIDVINSGMVCYICSEAGFIASYDIRNSQCLQKVSIGIKPVRCVSLSPDNSSLVAVSMDGNIVGFSLEDVLIEKYKQHSENHSDVLLRCAVSPDSKTFATAASANTVRIWDLSTGHLLQTFTPPPSNTASVHFKNREWIWDLKYTPDSSKLCTGSSDGICRVWNLETNTLQLQMPQLDKCISAICLIDI